MLRKGRLLIAKPNNQSRLKCCSTRRNIMRTQVARSISGGSSVLLCLGVLEHAGISGIPTQNSNKKAEAAPKYHGSNWFSIALPVATKHLYRCTLLLCHASDTVVLVSSQVCELPSASDFSSEKDEYICRHTCQLLYVTMTAKRNLQAENIHRLLVLCAYMPMSWQPLWLHHILFSKVCCCS